MQFDLIRWVLVVVLVIVVRFGARALLKNVGKKALAKQPDAYHLTQMGVLIWKDPPAVRKLSDALVACAFEEIGDYSITEMPQVKVRFLMKPADSVYACVYEHEKAGIWMDVITRYKEHRSVTFTTARDRGLEHRPGDIVVHAPGSTPQALYARLLAERPKGDLEEITAESALRLFEEASQQQLEWRRNRGVSAEEVARVGKTRVGKA